MFSLRNLPSHQIEVLSCNEFMFNHLINIVEKGKNDQIPDPKGYYIWSYSDNTLE